MSPAAVLREALRSDPNHVGAHVHLAIALERQGKTTEAIEHYQQALLLNHDRPSALNNLAWIFATDADSKLRNAAKALDLARKACRLTEYKDTRLMDTLAAAYAEAVQFAEAVETAQKARDPALATGQLELADTIERHLQRYKARKPCHEEAATRAFSAKTHGTGSAFPDLP